MYGCVVSAWSRWLFWRGLGQHRVTNDAAAPSSHSDLPVKNSYWAIHVPQQVHMLGIWGGAVPYYEVSSYTWGHLASLACREMPTAVSSLFQAEKSLSSVPSTLCEETPGLWFQCILSRFVSKQKVLLGYECLKETLNPCTGLSLAVSRSVFPVLP